MEESFFGFDTSVPLDDDGGGGRIEEPSEEEYDALNDETFGSAVNGDWEEAHENMVRTDTFITDSSGGCDSLDSSGVRQKNLSSVASSDGATTAYMNARMRRIGLNADSDLELNLTGMKLDDVDLSFDDNESFDGGIGGHINMDPSVWASQPVQRSLFGGHTNSGINDNASDFLLEHFQNQQNQFQHHQYPQFQIKSDKNGAHSNNAPKICTLEDIERNIIIQQTMQKQQQKEQQQQQSRSQLEQQQQQQARHQHDQQQQHKLLNDILKHSSKPPTPTQMHQQHQQHLQQQQQQQHLQQQHNQKQQILQKQQQINHQKGPPGFGPQQSPPRASNNFANNLAQHPLNNLLQQQPQQHQPNNLGSRLPPGFPLFPPGLPPHLHHQGQSPLPPHPLLNQHGMPANFPHPHLPVALNNFAMHPNFNAMRAAAAAAGIHPVALVPPPRILMHPPNAAAMHNQQQYNMFNMRLVQEIQQNHPMLQNAARQSQNQVPTGFHPYAHNLQFQQQQLRGNGGNASINKQNQMRRESATGNGNLPHEEYDEYANLMSTRDKHWLIGIQLSQLNTDTPFIDDYYYTVYRERKAALSGNRHSQAHKDNQLNHPLTQPSGHAQLILVQLGNKNGTRNGQHRERRSSETGSVHNGSDQKMPYVFTPLKFENSLGKLQYGSVTAPRKIIDAEIMSSETDDGVQTDSKQKTLISKTKNANSTTNAKQHKGGVIGDTTTSAQRKSRHILLHIETLYRLVLKLEDLENPNAIATIIMKKKKESERIAALEQLENANKTPEERAAEAANPQQSTNPMLKNKFAYEIETKGALVEKLIAGLAHDKVVAMMNVRKGKALIRRIMPFIVGEEICWNVWMGVFFSLQNVVKKDREDIDGLLYALYPEFNEQIKRADFETIVRISSSVTLNEKKSNGVFCSRFGISALVCLIIQAEHIYDTVGPAMLDETHKKCWCKFLDEVATSLNRTIQNQTICAAIESYSIQPMMNHFARFKDLKLDSLLALITEAKQQIN